MPELPGAGRLDAETLAAYIDGQLAAEERARVEAEIAADPETYEWVVDTVRAVEDASLAPAVAGTPGAGHANAVPGERAEADPGQRATGPRARVLPFHRRRWFLGGAGALLAAAAAMVLAVRLQPEWSRRFLGPRTDPRIATLVDAIGAERYIEARLTGGFAFGPLRQVTRSGGTGQRNLRLLAVAADLERAATAAPSPGILHARGVAKLLVAEPEDAVASLERACSAGTSASCASDLCAAYLELHKIRPESGGLQMAIAQCDLAVRRDPTLPEARFNRALALTTLGDLSAAAAAWSAIVSDSTSDPWTQEARRRQSAIERQLGAPR